jgi:lambda family phage portal protein
MSAIDKGLNALESAAGVVDKTIGFVSPTWAVARNKSRSMLAAYEATKPNRLRKTQKESRGPDAVMFGAGASLRDQARYLDENHDLVTGILDTLVVRTVGPSGINVEPMVRSNEGEPLKEFNKELLDGFAEWYERPDVTGEYSGAQCEQLAARTWLRDGEQLTQHVIGMKPGLRHSTKTKYLIELLEPDLLPWDFEDAKDNIVQGVQKNAWGRPIRYWIYRQHPSEINSYRVSREDLKSVSADFISHIKLTRRIRQTRGVSVFHSVMTRIQDLKDYEESERVAARISAAMAAYIKKGSPDSFMPTETETDRSFKIAPGLVFDRLQAGEEIGTIQSNRPSALLEPFRNAMIRMISSGTRTSYSSASKSFDGSYSSQRQELVEQWDHYATLQSEFIASWKMPVYKNYIRAAIASGRHVIPEEIDVETLFNAHYQGPSMPWIDPNKESQANERDLRMGVKSQSGIIRARNLNPTQLRDQIKQDRQFEEENDLVFSGNAKHDLVPVVQVEETQTGANSAKDEDE